MVKIFPAKLRIALVVGLVNSLCFSLVINATEQIEETTLSEPLPLEELRTFAEVYNRIKSSYVEDVDDQALLNGAIAGMLDSLDPHSSFLNKEDYSNVQDLSSGQYGGLGIEVIPENDALTIISPIDDSPAQRAGILPGDQIVKVNNTPLRKIKAQDALDLMRGEIGETVHLSIRRDGENKLLEFALIREIIRLSSIQSKWLGNGIAYLRITQFQHRTGNDLAAAISTLAEQGDRKITALVLDLRNNPGGVLFSAEAVSDAFLEQGLIVSTRGKTTSSNTESFAKKGDLLNGAPMVVLINNGSASASEIVAGALQDQGRAIIMGTRSFGKGSVQTLISIGENTALKLTTARYYTPGGRSIQGSGIVPDIVVRQTELLSSEDKKGGVFESDLKGALANENVNDNEELSSKKLANKKEIELLLDNDFQLSEAVNLLRSINILSLTTSKKVLQSKEQ